MKEMLLLACEIGLPDNDIRDIDEYINHNERGLAFEFTAVHRAIYK